MSRYVAITIDGELTIHAQDTSGNYATLCGVDGDDPICGQYPAELPLGRRINCPHCRSIFDVTKKYRTSDFEI